MKAVHTLDDLESREHLDKGAALPARLAVVGFPVAHSASPRMHQAALDANSLPMRYIRLEVEPGHLPEAFERMQALGFVGCNVTVPHKFAALEACAKVDPNALMLGAVNTVRFDEDGPHGFNTDGPGFARAIESDFGKPLRELKVALLGAGGGAGQAIAAQCVLSGVEKLVLVNRTVEKLDLLVDRLARPGVELVPMSFDDASLAGQCRSCDLIVNTSSVGLKAGDPALVSADALRRGHFVYDTIYQPEITPLLALARGAGCEVSNGKSMLLHQGALAFQIWFPNTNPLELMRTALLSPAEG